MLLIGLGLIHFRVETAIGLAHTLFQNTRKCLKSGGRAGTEPVTI